MDNYWEQRYLAEGMIWGDKPSLSVITAGRIFTDNNVSVIFIPGCGYGRNADYFIKHGYEVSGSEISKAASEIAIQLHPELRIQNCDSLNWEIIPGTADAVFAYNFLHLFRKDERSLLIGKWSKALRPGGIIFCTVFSENENSFGKGKETESGSFESKPGRAVHYFSEKDLIDHFRNFKLIETEQFEESEDHGGEKHTHNLRYIAVKKEN